MPGVQDDEQSVYYPAGSISSFGDGSIAGQRGYLTFTNYDKTYNDREDESNQPSHGALGRNQARFRDRIGFAFL